MCDAHLQLLAGILAFPHKRPIFSDVVLEVIKHLQLFIQSNQSVQLVLQLNVFFFQSKLELVLFPLIKKSVSEAGLGHSRCHCAYNLLWARRRSLW